MKINKLIRILVISMVLISTSTALTAEGFKHKSPEKHVEHMMKRWDRLKTRLNLTAEQEVKFDQLNDSYKIKYIALGKTLKPLHDQLKTEKSNPSANYVKTELLMKQASDVMIRMKIMHMKQRDEIKKILTKEQAESFSKMRHPHVDKHHEHKKKWYQKKWFKKE